MVNWYMIAVWRVHPMLNRRQVLQSTIAADCWDETVLCKKDPWVVYYWSRRTRFHNATVLDAKGTVYKNWGGEVKDGVLSLSKDITDGSDLEGSGLCPISSTGCTVGLYEVELESSTHDDSESSGSEQLMLIAGDGYNPLSETIPTIRANGIGSVILHPSFNRLIAGSMSLVHLAGVTRAESVVPGRLSVCV